ncbi:ATP-binding protein [Streptomyces sp. NBC_00510]
MPDFEDAIRPAEFARIGLAGLPGAGATYTALGIGTGMLPDGGTLGVIDTGRGASAHLAEVFPHRQLRLHSFEPQAHIRSLAVAADRGIDVLVVDNASPFWSGRNGALAQVDASIARRPKGDNGSRWRDVQPVLHDLTDALLTYPGHLVVTFRVAAEWTVTETEPGRALPVRVPTKVEQSSGLEYEFGLFGTLDAAHTLTVDKSHYLAVPVGSRHELPGEDFGRAITDWLAEADGSPASSRDFAAAATEHWQTPDALFALLKEAEHAGLLGAAVLDLGGNPTKLGRLIALMGTAARIRASVNDIGTLQRIARDLDKAGRLNLLFPGMDGTPVRIGDLIKTLQSTPPGSAGAQAMDAAHGAEGSAA